MAFLLQILHEAEEKLSLRADVDQVANVLLIVGSLDHLEVQVDFVVEIRVVFLLDRLRLFLYLLFGNLLALLQFTAPSPCQRLRLLLLLEQSLLL